MKPQQQVKDLFADALEQPAEQREAFVEAACHGDAMLLELVRAMLRAHDQAGAFLSSPTQPDVPFPDTRTAKDNKPAEGPGTVIGNYKLLQEIGHGGFGVVYMAEQEQPVRRNVALKIIKLGMDTKQVIARFEAERQALAMMDHPNIAKVLDAGATDTGRPYFVMELVRGVPVTEYCDTENLNTHSRLELFMQICHAVQHAHTKGIIHRDIKPSNVMITLHDGVPVPKVIDFGIAKATHQRLTEKTLFTQYGQLVGTPAYMSPEQAEMSGLDIDTRSDIYSLGVLLYELLTGTTPFSTQELREGGFAEIQRIIREQEPHKPSTRVSSLLSEPRPSESAPSEPRAPATGQKQSAGRVGTAHQDENAVGTVHDNAERVVGDAHPTRTPSTVGRGATGVGEAGSSPPRGSASVDSTRGTLADKLPVAPRTRTSVVDIARHRRTDPSSLSRQLRGDLDWIVMKALEKDRTRRYETANGFAADVQRHLDDEPVVAGPPSAAYRLSKFVRRNRTGVITAGAVLALLLAGIAGTTWGLIREQAAKQAESQQREIAEEKTTEAQDNLQLAREQEQKANAARDEAQKQKQRADNARQIAEERTEELRRTVYLNNISMADIAYNAGDVRRMKELLKRCDTDLRAWEWGRLKFLAGYQEPPLNPDSPFLAFGSSDAVSSVAFSPDGERIVSGSNDKTLRLWDVFTGAHLLTLPGHEGAISSVAFSPDGERIVSGSEDKTLKIWNASTGEEILTLPGHDGQVSSVAFSPDGELIVSGSWDKTLKIWDADSGQEIMTLRGDKRTVSSAAFSPDGMRIVSGSWDKTLTLWNTKTGKEIRTFVGHEGAISSVAFSPDGNWIASGSWDATVRLWDAATGEEIRSLRGHESPVNSVAFSPNGRRIVSGGDDEMLKLWDAYTGEEVLTHGAGAPVLAVAFGPDGSVIVSGNSEEYDFMALEPVGMSLKLWEVPGETITSAGHDGQVSSIAFSPDGKKIVSASDDKTLKIWDADSGEKIKTLRGHDAEVSSAAFSPDGMRIVSGSRDNTLKVWNTKTGEEIRTLVGHEGWVKTVAFSPDGRWIASGSEDKTVKVWDASTGGHIRTLVGHQRSVNTVSFSPHGRQIVSGSYDETLKLWDASTGREILSFHGHEGLVGTVAFSRNGENIVSGSSDRTLKVWDVSTGKEILTLYGHIGSVSAVAFSPDGKRIVSGSFDKTLKVWDVSTGQETLTLRGHIGYVSAVAFSPDGTRIVSGSADGALKVWETWQESGRPRAETLD